MNKRIAGVALSLLLGGLISIAGMPQTVQSSSIGVTEVPDLGMVLVDERGFPLYRFTEDVPGESTCAGDCEQVWPIVHAEITGLPESVDASHFSELERPDGRLQTTYLGWPLYTYAGDTVPGQVNGEGVNDQWFAVGIEGLLPLVAAWMNEELVDVLTGESFRVSDFYGKPVFVESFAVWCSTCLRQQREMAKLVESEGEAIIHISLDTDPNEDADAVRAHAARHGFEWLFAVPPVDLTRTLIDEFGLTIVNAPRAPVILVEADGSTRLLRNGVKTAASLLEEIAGGRE